MGFWNVGEDGGDVVGGVRTMAGTRRGVHMDWLPSNSFGNCNCHEGCC